MSTGEDETRTPTWRERLRKKFFRRSLPGTVGENPLEVLLISWAFLSGSNALINPVPSVTLQSLPHGMKLAWAVSMLVAASVTLIALVRRTDSIVASGLYMFTGTQTAFAIALLGNSGWSRGGITGCLYLIIGLVAFMRGWWLKGDEARYNRQVVRNPRRGY